MKLIVVFTALLPVSTPAVAAPPVNNATIELSAADHNTAAAALAKGDQSLPLIKSASAVVASGKPLSLMDGNMVRNALMSLSDPTLDTLINDLRGLLKAHQHDLRQPPPPLRQPPPPPPPKVK